MTTDESEARGSEKEIKIGRYWLISSSHGFDRPDQLVLDTNVAIDIERFYFGSGSFPREDLKNLLMEFCKSPSFWRSSKMYGFAALESLWDRRDRPHMSNSRRMGWAASRVLDWSPEKIESEFSNRHPPVSRDKKWPRGCPEVDLDTHGHPLHYLLLVYASLLYICHLEQTRSKWRQKGADWAISHLREWMRDELGAVCGYELTLATQIFIGNADSREPARDLLKLGRRGDSDAMADKIWHSAWDMYFLRWTDGSLLMRKTGEMPPEIVLVTGDEDPWHVRLRTQTKLNWAFDGKILSLLVHEGSALNPKVPKEVINAIFEPKEDLDHEYYMPRLHRDRAVLFEQGLNALEALESAMGIQDSTVQFYKKHARPIEW